MSIADELLEAAEEMAFSFSQEQWEQGLVIGWKSNTSMAGVLFHVSGLTSPVSRADWDKLQQRAATLNPALSPHSRINQPCRAWIATHASKASDCFWDGNFDKAKSLLRLGGVRQRSGMVRAIKAEEKKDTAGVLLVKVRERDTRTNWNVCK